VLNGSYIISWKLVVSNNEGYFGMMSEYDHATLTTNRCFFYFYVIQILVESNISMRDQFK